MSAAGCVAGMLRAAGIDHVFSRPVGADACAEPVVCSDAGYERSGLFEDGERGERAVEVRVVRRSPGAAEWDALSCARALAPARWEPFADAGGGERVCGVEAGAPSFELRDGSGRWVWLLPVTVHVDRAV